MRRVITLFKPRQGHLLPPSLLLPLACLERASVLYSSPQQQLAGFLLVQRITMNTSAHAAGRSAPVFANRHTKLLIAAQWLLTGIGIFCLVGVVMIIALTPEAWPL